MNVIERVGPGLLKSYHRLRNTIERYAQLATSRRRSTPSHRADTDSSALLDHQNPNDDSRLNSLIASVDEIVFEFDLSGRYLNIWTADENLLAKPKHSMIGRTIAEVLGPELAGQFLELFQRVIATGKPESIEYPLNVLGGERWFRGHISPIRSHDGRNETVRMQARDITDQKLKELEKERFVFALRSITECVSITNMEDIIVFVNDAFLETYGFAESELLGKHVSIVRSSNNPPEVIQQILPSTIKGVWKGELYNRRKDGTEFPIHLSASLIRDEKGEAVALVGVATDITERKRSEENLKSTLSLLSATLESTADGILVVDAQGSISSCNKKFLELWRMPESVIKTQMDEVAFEICSSTTQRPGRFSVEGS